MSINQVIERNPPYAAQAAQVIRNAILDGNYEPGARLSEPVLARDLGVSRSPIREALQVLANEGLIELVPGRGAFVASFEPSQITELFQVREALEGMAARLAAQHADPRATEELRRLLAQTRSAIEGPDRSGYPVDLDFHQHVISLSGNRWLENKAREIDWQLRLARMRSGEAPRRAAQAYEDHLAILTAISDGDPELAESQMRRHVRDALTSVLHTFNPDARRTAALIAEASVAGPAREIS